MTLAMFDLPTNANAPLEDLLLEASRLSDSGEDGEAMQLLLSAEPEHARDPMLLCLIGMLADRVGSEGMAADYYRRALDQEPTDPQILITAGAGLAHSGDPAAEAALRLAALTAPELPAAHLHYGALLVRSGLFEQGLDELRTAYRLAPGEAEPALELAIGLLLARRPAEALELLEEAAGEEDPAARLLLGLVLLQEGELERAAEELHPIAGSFGEDAEVQLLLALLFMTRGWEDESWLALSRAEAANPPADPDLVREIEEALEGDEEALADLLLDEIAPSALRDRIVRR